MFNKLRLKAQTEFQTPVWSFLCLTVFISVAQSQEGLPIQLPPPTGSGGQTAVGRPETPPKNNDWLVGAAVPQVNPGTAKTGTQGNRLLPVPVNSGRLLLGEARAEAGATFRVVYIGGKVTPTMRWSNDGKSLYLLEETGTLHKISFPEFREEKVLPMQQQAAFMVMARSGLAIGLPLLQEVWLINPDTLQLLKRIPVGKLTSLTGSPVLNKVYAKIQDDVISVVDLQAGKVTTQWRAKEILFPGSAPAGSAPGRDLGNFHFAKVTPDGKYLMIGDGNLNRLRIKGDTLIFEERGPGIVAGRNSRNLEISADSRYVALVASRGNINVSGQPQAGTYATYVYKITDLNTPVITIQSGAYPQTLAFDKAAGLIYAHNSRYALMTFTATGLQQKVFDLGLLPFTQPSQFLPHPQGRKVLILADNALIWVDLSEFPLQQKPSANEGRSTLLPPNPKGPSAPTKAAPLEAAPSKTVLLRVRAFIDGSDELHVSQTAATWVHKEWSLPQDVTVNGIKWDISLKHVLVNAASTQFLQGQIDFSSARLINRTGRDSIVLKSYSDGLSLFFADGQDGAADYDVIIALTAKD